MNETSGGTDYVSRKCTLKSLLYTEKVIQCTTKKHERRGISKRECNIPQKSVNDLIRDVVYRVQMIMIHLSHFVKLYLCHLDSTDNLFPIIDKSFLFNAICPLTYAIRNNGRFTEKNKRVISILTKFYNEHYVKFLPVKICRSGIRSILDSQLDLYLTNINNNIHAQYWNRLKEYINIKKNVKENKRIIDSDPNKLPKDKIKEKGDITRVTTALQFDLLTNNNNSNDPDYASIFQTAKIPNLSEYKEVDLPIKIEILKKKGYPKILEELYDDFTLHRQMLNNEQPPDDRLNLLIKCVNDKEINYNNNREKIRLEVEKERIYLEQSYNYNHQFSRNPTLYLQSLFRINNLLKEDEVGKFHSLPLFKSAIPPYITLTTSSVEKLFTENNLSNGEIKDKNKDKTKENKSISDYDKWRKHFHLFKNDTIENKQGTELRKQFRRKGYHFHYILTDGVGATILFENNKISNKKNESKTKYVDKAGCPSNEKEDTPYLSDENIDASVYDGLNVVAIDPNKVDVLYCTDGHTDTYKNRINPASNDIRKKKINTFRYTKPQINHESGKRKYENIINDAKKVSKINDIESELSHTHPKSNNYKVFVEYLEVKIRTLSEKLLNHYRYDKPPNVIAEVDDASYRKMRLNYKMNLDRSESNMLNNFKKKFGDVNETIVCFGNYGQGHLKGAEPVKGKEYRRLFKKRGYKVFLIDEFKTSKLCHSCHGELKYFHKKSDRKKKENAEDVEDERDAYVHGVLRCKNCYNMESMNIAERFGKLMSIKKNENPKIWKDGKKYKVWNRDLNASLNILMKAKYEILKKDTNIIFPEIFSRKILDV